MSDVAVSDYNKDIEQALVVRKAWLEGSELKRVKEELRTFQTAYSVLYSTFLKKKMISEDPYKDEIKIADIEVPETGPLNEARKREQISLRLASYDNDLDFLVNFFQFSFDYLNPERVQRIQDLVCYIDWRNLSAASPSANTKAVSEIVANIRSEQNTLLAGTIDDALSILPGSEETIIKIMQEFSVYHKEVYKLNVRLAIGEMPADEANPDGIRKKMRTAMPGVLFIKGHIEELIREDYSDQGPGLRKAVLKDLFVEEKKPESPPEEKIPPKDILLYGVQAMGTASSEMRECARKIDENQILMERRKKGLWEMLVRLIQAIMNSKPEEVVYELVYLDPEKGIRTRYSLRLRQFRDDLDRRIATLAEISSRGPITDKLAAAAEEKIFAYLERMIRDIQNTYKALAALDEYFKTNAPSESQGKIRGIKPELASINNCLIKANQLVGEYNAAKTLEHAMTKQ